MARFFPLLVLIALHAGCRHPGDEDLGLGASAEGKLAVERLNDPTVLLAALRQRVAEAEPRLGAHAFDLQQTLELSGDDHGKARSDRTEERVHLDADGKGAVHLVREIDHPDQLAPTPKSGDDESGPRTMIDPYAQGMELVSLPPRFFVRARYGRAVERRAEPGEIDRLRSLGERVLGDDVALLLRFASLEDRGAGELQGRHTRKLSLGKREAPLPADAADREDPRRAWRAEMTVSELKGELELDAETGVPLRATIDARYATSGKSPLQVHLSLQQTPRPPAAIAPLADSIVSPHRPRPTPERNQLLEGLAPPVGPQGGRQ